MGHIRLFSSLHLSAYIAFILLSLHNETEQILLFEYWSTFEEKDL